MHKTIQFISGLPRSGSTLLCNMLAMSPDNYVTPTSNLNPLLCDIRNGWHTMQLAKTEGLAKVLPQMRAAMAGFITGYFEPVAGRHAWDKNRSWVNEIELLEDVLQRPVRVVYPVRPVEEIVASFEKIFRKSTLIRPDVARQPDVYKRVNMLLDDNGVVGSAVSWFHSIFQKGHTDRVMFVPYRNIVQNPLDVLADVHEFCGVEPFEYDVSKLERRVYEDDALHGFMPDALHGFRKELTYAQIDPYQYMPSDAVDEIRQNLRYSIISDLCR